MIGKRRRGPSAVTRSIYGPLTSRGANVKARFYKKGEKPKPTITDATPTTVEEPHPDAPAPLEPFDGTKPFNLTLIVAPEDDREKFQALGHKHTYHEIRPNREPGQRGAYQVEMTYEEYSQALEHTKDPDVNLIAVEPEKHLQLNSVPGATVENYMNMGCQDDLGLDGKEVDVGVIDLGFGDILTNYFAGRVKAKQGFGGADPDDTALTEPNHGAHIASISTPPAARLVAAAFGLTDTSLAEALYWMVDEAGVHIVTCSFGSPTSTTIKADAVAHAVSKNVHIFASRGNDSNTTPNYPASYSGVHAITNFFPSTNEIDPLSSYGSDVWAAAGGAEIYAMQSDGVTETYIANGGTSDAAAVATRTAALLLSGGASFGNLITTMEKGAMKTGADSQYEGVGVLQLCTSVALNTPPAPPDGRGSAIGPGSTSETDSGAGGSGDFGSIGTIPGDVDPDSPECVALLEQIDAFNLGSITAQQLADYLGANFGIDLETEFPSEWASALAGTPQQVTVSVCGQDITFTLDRVGGVVVDPHLTNIPLPGPMTLTRTGYSPNSPGEHVIIPPSFNFPFKSIETWQNASMPVNELLDLAGNFTSSDVSDRGDAVLEQKDPSLTLTLSSVQIQYLTDADISAIKAVRPNATALTSAGFYVAFAGEFYVNWFWRWWQRFDGSGAEGTGSYMRAVRAGWPIVLGVQQRSYTLPSEGDVWVFGNTGTGLSGWTFADWARGDITGGGGFFKTTGATLEDCADPALQFIGTEIDGWVRLPDQTNPTRVAFFLMSPPEFYDQTGYYVPIRGSDEKGTTIVTYIDPNGDTSFEDRYRDSPVPYPTALLPDSVWLTTPIPDSPPFFPRIVTSWMSKRHEGTDAGWYYERGPWIDFDPNGVTSYQVVITDAQVSPTGGGGTDVPQLNTGLDLDNPPIMDIPMPDFPSDFPCVDVADVGVGMCLEDMTMPEMPMPCFPDFPFGDCPPAPGTGSGIGDFGPAGEIPPDDTGNGVGTGITAGKETFAEDKCFSAGTSLQEAINELSDDLGLSPEEMTIEGTCDDTLENEKCFPKGSSIWDAIWWLSDQCGKIPIDGGGNVLIADPTPLDTTWILNEYTNLFDFTPVLDSSELFWAVECMRPEITKGGTVISPGLDVMVQVPTVFSADPQEIFRITVDPGATEAEATATATGLARKMGRMSFRVTATTFFNPNLRLRHRIRIVRPSKGFDMEFMCTSISHDLSETGKFTTVEAQVILDEPTLVPA